MNISPILRASIEQCFLDAVVRLHSERRAGRDGNAFLQAANAIEAAWPEVIADYRKRMGW